VAGSGVCRGFECRCLNQATVGVPGISKWVPGVSHLVLHLSRHPVATVATPCRDRHDVTGHSNLFICILIMIWLSTVNLFTLLYRLVAIQTFQNNHLHPNKLELFLSIYPTSWAVLVAPHIFPIPCWEVVSGRDPLLFWLWSRPHRASLLHNSSCAQRGSQHYCLAICGLWWHYLWWGAAGTPASSLALFHLVWLEALLVLRCLQWMWRFWVPV